MIIRRYRPNPHMISILTYFKQRFIDFFNWDYPQMLEADGLSDKVIGLMLRQGARDDAKAYIQQKRKESKISHG